MGVIHDLSDLESTGMLWFINRVVMEPRGYTMFLVEENGAARYHESEPSRAGGRLLGWTILRSETTIPPDDEDLRRAEWLFKDLVAGV